MQSSLTSLFKLEQLAVLDLVCHPALNLLLRFGQGKKGWVLSACWHYGNGIDFNKVSPCMSQDKIYVCIRFVKSHHQFLTTLQQREIHLSHERTWHLKIWVAHVYICILIHPACTECCIYSWIKTYPSLALALDFTILSIPPCLLPCVCVSQPLTHMSYSFMYFASKTFNPVWSEAVGERLTVWVGMRPTESLVLMGWWNLDGYAVS